MLGFVNVLHMMTENLMRIYVAIILMPTVECNRGQYVIVGPTIDQLTWNGEQVSHYSRPFNTPIN